MKRTLLFFFLPFVPSCYVDNDVAENPDDVSAETRIATETPDWCERTCQRLADCPSPGCDCVDDLCECSDPPDAVECAADCREAFADQYTGHGEACAEAGLRQMSCFDSASCEEILGSSPCVPTDQELETCGGSVSPPAPDGLGPVSCQISMMQGLAPGAATFSCATGSEDCSDGHEYASQCTEVAPGLGECTCSIDGQVTGYFALPELVCPSQADVYVGCDFWLPLTYVPPMGAVTCQGAIGTGPGNPDTWGCGSEFSNCGGLDLALRCTEEDGIPTCHCYVDGSKTSSFVVPDHVCPGNGMAEDLRRINIGCGWVIVEP